jgi:hypothetical protein
MFKKPLIAISILLLVSGALVAVSLVHVTMGDMNDFTELLALRRRNPQDNASISSNQDRKTVSKDILICENPYRLHFRLQSAESSLLMNNLQDKIEVIENMTDLHGLMQEVLYYVMPDGREVIADNEGTFRLRSASKNSSSKSQIFDWDPTWQPMQEVRFFEAERGSYNYSTRLFQASEVYMVRFRVAGHDLDRELEPELLQKWEGLEETFAGTAESVEFFFGGKEPALRAKHLKATVHLNRR